MSKKSFTEKQIKEIIELYTIDNYSLTKIGKLFNCDKGTIRRILIKNDIEIRNPSIENLVGKKFGMLTVIEQTKSKNNKNRKRYWKCKCECGNIVITTTDNLKSNHATSCGCKRKNTLHEKLTKDWKGFVSDNGIEFISRSNKQSSEQCYFWNCKCPFCGNIFLALPYNVVEGKTNSCGCRRIYKGEKIIEQILENNNIEFTTQYPMKFSEKHKKQFFDFAIYKNGILKSLIEFDGKQHFEPVDRFGGEEEYRKTRERDLRKNIYCIYNGIPLYRIPYTKINKIKTANDIFNNKYLIQNERDKYMIKFKQKDCTKFYKEPTRGTEYAAGYDVYCSEDIVIPSYFKQIFSVLDDVSDFDNKFGTPKTLKEAEEFNKEHGLTSVLVSTNTTYEIDDDKYIGVYSRSGISSKNLLVLANSVGVADSDYSGEIKISVLNLSPHDVIVKKGEKIAQLIIDTYIKTDDDDQKDKKQREENEDGGFGSTGV